MRVLVADRLSEESLDEMRALGVDVVYEPDLRADALPEALENINVLVVRGTEVSGEAVDAGTALNLIIRAGAGLQQHRRRVGERTRHLRRHTPGQECVSRGRAHVHADRLPRSPGTGRRRQSARREVGKTRVCPSDRPGRAQNRHPRHGARRPRRAASSPRPTACGRTHSAARSRRHAPASSASPAPRAPKIWLERSTSSRSTWSSSKERGKSSAARCSRRCRTAPSSSTRRDAELVDYDALARADTEEAAARRARRASRRAGQRETPVTRTPALERPGLRHAAHRRFDGRGANRHRHGVRAHPAQLRHQGRGAERGQHQRHLLVALPARRTPRSTRSARSPTCWRCSSATASIFRTSTTRSSRAAARPASKIRLAAGPATTALQEIMAFSDEVLHVDLVTLPNLA